MMMWSILSRPFGALAARPASMFGEFVHVRLHQIGFRGETSGQRLPRRVNGYPDAAAVPEFDEFAVPACG